MKVNADKIAEFLGMRSIGVIDVPTGGQKDSWGGWDTVNSSEFVSESRRLGGQQRAKGLPAHNRSEMMRASSTARNIKYNPGNKFRLGVPQSMETRQKISENNGSRGSRWMTLEGNSKKVPKNQIDDHLKDGWKFGRVMR